MVLVRLAGTVLVVTVMVCTAAWAADPVPPSPSPLQMQLNVMQQRLAQDEATLKTSEGTIEALKGLVARDKAAVDEMERQMASKPALPLPPVPGKKK